MVIRIFNGHILSKEKGDKTMNPKKLYFKRIVSIILAIVIGVGTPLAVDMGSSYLSNKFDFHSVLSAYAADIVDTEGAVGIDATSMNANSHIIDLVNEDGINTLYLFSEPISYKDEEGELKTKDITVEEQNDTQMEKEGFDYTNGQNDYRIHFSSNSDKCMKVMFEGGSYSLRPRTLYTVQGQEGIAQYLSDTFEVFEYPNLYGERTNLRFYPQLNGVKDDIVLNENIGMSSFSFVLSTENCSAVKNEDGTISLISDTTGENVQTFSAPYAYDSVYVEGLDDEHYGACAYELETLLAGVYILTVQVDEEWLDSESTIYPVVIDPTTSNISNSQDTWASKTNTSKNYGSNATMGMGHNSGHSAARSMVQFDVPTSVHKGATISSAYLWQRETGEQTGTFYVRPYLIKKAWTQGTVNWNNQPTYDSSKTLARKNLNGASTDSSSSNFWYKFNITSAVHSWVNTNVPNYGLMYVSEHEAATTTCWRVFATKEHATSSYRPYAVISYTNDTTAPTATLGSVPTAWTNEDVTLTISNAADNTGGSGLAAKAYSFSASSSTYSWQESPSKTFSQYSVVHAHVRDAEGNITYLGARELKIDKMAPTFIVSGAPTDWTNEETYVLSVVAMDETSIPSFVSGILVSGVAAYSFSEEKDVYHWQASSGKEYTGNRTVYVTTKDYAGNISDTKTVVVYTIDTIAPEAPQVSRCPNCYTRENVKLEISIDIADHRNVYSFSTEPGVYNWESSCSKTIYDNCVLYVYAKDPAGNISEPTVVAINEIDKETYENITITKDITEPTNKDVTVTVEGTEGLDIMSYSFSYSLAGSAGWQAGNSKKFSSNQRVEVYIKLRDGKEVYVGGVTIDNIEKTPPRIDDVIVEETEDGIQVTVEATGQNGENLRYSYDGGRTYTDSNEHIFSESIPNSILIFVKDDCGNVVYKTVDLLKPKFYREGDLVGIYNPMLGSDRMLEYKIGNGEWQTYYAPFGVPANGYTTVYARISGSEAQITGNDNAAVSERFTSYAMPVVAYYESTTDFSFTYKDITFDFTRSYNDWRADWFLSTDSYVETVDDYVKKVVLPDATELTFIKVADEKYVNEIRGYELIEFSDGTGSYVKTDELVYHYDNSGKIIKITKSSEDESTSEDAITITRTANSIVISDSAEGAAKRSYVLTLDEEGKVIQATDPMGGMLTYSYDDEGSIAEVIDQAGVVIGKYVHSGGLLYKSMDKSIDCPDDFFVYTYDSGAYVNVDYNTETNTITTEDSKGNTTTIIYDDAFYILSDTDEEGNATEYTYDEYHRILTETTGGTTTTYTYDEESNVTSIVTDNGETEEITTYSYDDNGRLLSEVSSESATYYIYEENVEEEEIVHVATLKEEYLENPPESFNAENAEQFDIVTHTYVDDFLKKTEANGQTITYEYDAYGNQIVAESTTTEGDEQKVERTEYTYDKNGNLTQSKVYEVNGTQQTLKEYTSYTYDAAGRTLLADEDGKCTRTIYDNLGRVIQEIGSEDYETTKDGLQEETPNNTYADALAGHTYVYNAITGLLTSETDRLGKTTSYVYNDKGNKIEEIFDIYHFYYTDHGEIEKAKINGVVAVEYDYDDKHKNYDRLCSETYANGDQIRYTYNNNGDVLAQYENDEEEASVTYTYNTDGELTEKTDHNTGLKYTYGDNNQVQVYRDSDNTLLYSYVEQETSDEEEEDTEEEDTEDVPIVSTENHFGNAYTKETSEQSVTYTLTDYNTSFESTMDGEEEKVVSDSIKYGTTEVLSATYAYDEKDRITGKNYGEESLDFVNTYDEEDRITNHGYADTQWNYSYDKHSQLTRVNSNFDNGYTTLYNYDNRGNILSKKTYALTDGKVSDTAQPTETKTFTYQADGWTDLLVQVNDKTLTYDQNGNVLTYGDRTFTWERGRILSQITEGENTYFYTYDDAGIRTSKTVNGTTTYYNTEDGVILSQTDGTTAMLFQYDSNGTLAGFTHITKDENQNDIVNQYYYITNQMGDVCGITDASGNLLATYKYDEWGNQLAIEATAGENQAQNQAIAEANPFRYRSYYYDLETGYYYLQSRYYDASICRFINADDIEFAGVDESMSDINLFVYCGNSPINDNDFNGHISWTSVKKAIKNIVNNFKKFVSGLVNYVKKKINKFVGKVSCRLNNGYFYIATSPIGYSIDAIIMTISGVVKGALLKGGFTLTKMWFKANKPAFKVFFRETVIPLLKNTAALLDNMVEYIVKRFCVKYVSIVTKSKIQDRIWGKFNTYKWISAFSSVGSFVATFLDILDGKWDEQLAI